MTGPLNLDVGRRQRTLEACERRGFGAWLQPLHDLGRRSLLVLAYHRLAPAGSLDEYPLDLELLSATTEQFRWQMSYLASRHPVVTLQQVADAMRGGKPIPPGAVAVTFDDGAHDTYDLAFPVLAELKIPATVFPVTRNLDSGEPFWFETVTHLMMTLPAGTLAVEGLRQHLPLDGTVGGRRRSVQLVHDALKRMPDAQRRGLLADWASRFARPADEPTAALMRPMTWAQVEEMAAHGIEFGSHSVTHPNLTQLSDEELEWELVASRRELARRTGQPIDVLAYPIGTPHAYDRRVIEAARQAGYQLAVTYRPGTNWLGTLDPFALRRQGVTLRTTQSYFRAMLRLPAWCR